MTDLLDEYNEVEILIKKFQNDSAIAILYKMQDLLIEEDLLDSRFGLKVQDKLAEALEKDHQDELALQKLNQMVKLSADNQCWDIQANTYISLARMYEKIGRQEQCYSSLQKSRQLIKKHQLDSLYTRFAVRLSSYHRIYAEKDSAIHYANEVLKTANQFNQKELEGTGHLLLGLLRSDSAFHEARNSYIRAGNIWKKIGDISGYGAIQLNLCKLSFENGDLRNALVYNDSALVAIKKIQGTGHDQEFFLSTVQKYRGDIFRELDMLDSAIIYLEEAQNLQLKLVEESNQSKIIEIDAKYNTQLKEATILDQKKQIEHVTERRKILISFLTIVLILSIILTLAYFKLLSANIKTKEQSRLIQKTNQQLNSSLNNSLTLQSELNHRVKNNLQLILSLMELESNEILDPIILDKFHNLSQRIYSMASTHEIFSTSNFGGRLNTDKFIHQVCTNFKNSSRLKFPITINTNINPIEMSLETLIPLGMILHEVLTNSVKHFMNHHPILEINISLGKKGEFIAMSYSDNGPGLPSDKNLNKKDGTGTYLINSMIRELKGHWNCFNNDGLVLSIYLKNKITPK